MSDAQRHIIGKLVVDVEFNQVGIAGNGVDIQKMIIEWVHNKLLPVLKSVLKNLPVPANEIIRIDRLIIDLGSVDVENWESEIIRQLPDLLREELKIVGVGKSSDIEAGEEIISSEGHVLKAFIYFLNYGWLPWWFPLKEINDWEKSILENLEKTRVYDVELKEILKKENALKRLVEQFSEVFFEKVITYLFVDEKQSIVEFKAIKGELFDVVKSNNRQEKLLNKLFLEWVAEDVREGNIRAFILKRIVPFLKSISSENQLFELIKKDKIIEGAIKNSVTPNKIQLNKIAGELSIDKSLSIDKIKKKGEGNKIAKNEIQKDGFEITEAIYVKHAGMVIFAPYLTRYFDNVEVLENGKIIDIEKAIHLVGYLASGKVKMPEYELVLAKLICGYPLESPISESIELSEKEKRISQEMLEAVIKNWSRLGNTSVDGLRETFFARDGKLSQKEDGGWLLQVEQKAFDILMDDLPWSISYIKLPWMPEVLTVEWV